MKIALIGNPNSGKTTLFNRLTGEHYAVGNRAGVTVEPVRAGFGGGDICDLPGIYSLKRPVSEEKIASDFLKSQNTDLIINVVDATHLVRNLYLTVQLLALGKKVVVALNMRDELEKKGLAVDCEKLSSLLGCAVVPISARRDKSFDALFTAAEKNYGRQRLFPSSAPDCYRELDKIGEAVITRIKRRDLAEKLDKILLNKYLALPIFVAIMSAVLFIGTGVFGVFLGGLIDRILSSASEALARALSGRISDGVLSLVCDGIIAGIGGVLEFAPLVAALFFMLSLLEDCGYLARVAFVTDRLFASLGLSGRTAISLVLGCGCTVPAVLGARAIPDEAERVRCLNSVHLMPCSAKLPLFAMLAGAFFPGRIFAVPLLYLGGVAAVVFVNLLSPRESNPVFIMEMPALKAPCLQNAAGETWRKLKSFLLRTCTVVFAASIIVWVLINFDFGFRHCAIEDSMLASAGEYVRYIFYPLGLTDWRAAAAITAGFAGKETVVGVLEVMSAGNVASVFSPSDAFIFAVFMLLSPPCAASLSALRKELGNRRFAACFARQILISYAVCALINLGFGLCAIA